MKWFSYFPFRTCIYTTISVKKLCLTTQKTGLILGDFLPFYPPPPPNIPENQTFEEMKKSMKILSFYTYHKWQSHDVLRYGTWRAEFIAILDCFLLFYPPPLTTQKIQNSEKRKKNTWRYDHFTHVDHKWQSYDVWFLRFLRNRVWQTEHFVIFVVFFFFYPPPPPPNNSEKKETWTYYHMCTINNNHMMYGSWEMECDRQFWIILDHFFALLTWRSKILKKWS